MKKLLVLILAIGSLVCSAQNNTTTTTPTGTLTSPNLVYSTVNPWRDTVNPSPGTWSGFDVTQSTGGGTSGGSKPGYNVETGTFMFGYTQSTIAYNYALSAALKNSGMSWLGYNYSWDYINQGYTRGTLSAKVNFTGVDGTALYSKNWDLKTTGANWTTVSGTEMFTSALPTSNIASFGLSFTGKDDRYWAGYYGPQVKNPSISVLYTFDACSTNPLSSTTCPGYEAAYKTQQCTANPLYASDCPGYAEAYKTQQCAANPLYDVTCPGYAEAYKTQQCTLDPLYDKTCTGYDAAYKKQQCAANPLYDATCDGYAAAYKTQQCTANPLYATDCPGYATAYFNAQCLKDSLYDKKCEGYATAYAIKYLVNLDPAVTTAVNQQLTTINETAKNDPAKVTVVNSTIDSVLTTPSTTSTSPASVTSVLAPPPPPPGASPVANAATAAAAPPPPPPPAKQEERAQEQKRTDGEVRQAERKAGGDPQNARKEVAQKAKDLARDASRANTMEGQVATQGLLVGLLGYVPGFAGYQQATVPDTNGLELARKYSKPAIDNQNAQRRLQGANDRLHREMVDSQYKN